MPERVIDPKVRAALVEQMRQESEGAANALKLHDPSVADIPVREMGWLMKLLLGGEGITGRQVSLTPWDNAVYYDPEQLATHYAQDPATARKNIEHELEHARQRMKAGSWWNWKKAGDNEMKFEYPLGPLETAGFAAENNLYKKWQSGDIYLKPEAKK